MAPHLFRFVACFVESSLGNLVIYIRNFTTLSSECRQPAMRDRERELSGF
jgi:hypothetical protein